MSKVVLLLFIALFFIPVSLPADTTDVTVTVRFFECNDGIDNDGDGDIDYPLDDGCSAATDDDESDEVVPLCNDGIDNDSDGDVDFPDDLGCESAVDNSEDSEGSSGGGSSGGGGGGSSALLAALQQGQSQLILAGLTAPNAPVVILRDGVFIGSATANASGDFMYQLTGQSSGDYLYTLYSVDVDGNRSALLTFFVGLERGALTEVSNIFIPPTISLADLEGGIVEGYSAPRGEVFLVNSRGETVVDSTTGENGFYRIVLGAVADEDETIRSKVRARNLESAFSRTEAFSLGAFSGNDVVANRSPSRAADFNRDGNVNIVDFSIAAFWYKKENVPARFDLDGNGLFDLRDFSVMVYYWSG